MENIKENKKPFECCDIVIGRNSTIYIDKEGRLWGYGWNAFGELGLGKKVDTVEKTHTHPYP